MERHAWIGIDIGGTFTDVCAWDGETFQVAKAPTTPDDLVRGVNAALDELGLLSESDTANEVRAAACRGGVSGTPPRHAAALTPSVIDIVQGSTVATNALLERKGVRTAFITTAGLGDLLRIGRQNRPKLYDLHVRKPSAIVDPGDCFEVPERLEADGQVLLALNEDVVKDLIDAIAARGIRSVAVCLLFSFLNSEHEQSVTRIAEATGLSVSRSSEILPELREFERASTTVINAYVAPLVGEYLQRLETALHQCGARNVRVMQSNGGQISASTAARHAVRTILSGPAGGVVAALSVGRDVGVEKLIAYDMGGTSTDVSLCLGQLAWTSNSVIDGWPVRVPMLDIHTIGAGGGSIAEMDAAGALLVGPRSAGADPGPACYGRSDEATVTDANVVLGRIRPENFLGGKMKIDPARSAAAIDRLAARMNVNRVAAALGVIRVANANMERAIKSVSAERGCDPRDCTLVSFGGAGGLHACDLAQSLRMHSVIIPANAGILSALGMLQADVLRDYSRSIRSRADFETFRAMFDEMTTQAIADLHADGHDPHCGSIERLADMRYHGQSHELSIPIETLDEIAAPFHAAHARTFGYANEGEAVEIVTLRVRCIAPTPKPVLPRLAPGDGNLERAMLNQHSVHFTSDSAHAVQTDHYVRSKLRADDAADGPAIIVESHATTMVPPGWKWRMHEMGHIHCQQY